jgi:hypothetical protein
MMTGSNPVGKINLGVIVGLVHVLINHKCVASFFRALIKSYQCTQSSYLTSMTIWMASETTFRPPQNLETTSVHQRKLAQILMGNVLNALDVQGCKSSSIKLGGQGKIRWRVFVELGKGRMQAWRDASK